MVKPTVDDVTKLILKILEERETGRKEPIRYIELFKLVKERSGTLSYTTYEKAVTELEHGDAVVRSPDKDRRAKIIKRIPENARQKLGVLEALERIKALNTPDYSEPACKKWSIEQLENGKVTKKTYDNMKEMRRLFTEEVRASQEDPLLQTVKIAYDALMQYRKQWNRYDSKPPWLRVVDRKIEIVPYDLMVRATKKPSGSP
ncbi:MAG TPA: hypothetical protein VE862_05290 [Candidatus Acidoferrum sp.]|nr:hypothetical protein [Candidatus Acidoferrum sp.]